MPSFRDIEDLVRERVEEWVLEILGQHKWLSFKGLFGRMAREYPKADEQEVKEALAYLIHDGRVKLTSRRKLVRAK